MTIVILILYLMEISKKMIWYTTLNEKKHRKICFYKRNAYVYNAISKDLSL